MIWWGATEDGPAPTSGHLLMIADNSALPAVAATFDALSPKVEVDIIGIEADQGYLLQIPATSDSLRKVTLSRLMPSTIVWAAGEYRDAGTLRRFLIEKRGMSVDQAHITTYRIAGQPQGKRPDERNPRRNLENRAAAPKKAERFIQVK